MNDNEITAKAVHEQLDSGFAAVLVSIIDLHGSAPRHEGTKMVVGENGITSGTIGGSLIEAAAVQQAKRVFDRKVSEVFTFELAGEDTSSSGMICGGKAEILLDYIPPSEENRNFSRRWHDIAARGKTFYFLTHFKRKDAEITVLGHAVLQPDNAAFTGTFSTTVDVSELKQELNSVSLSAVLNYKDTRIMIDRVRKQKTLYCFGAGHVAIPTARLAAMVGFRVIVLDDRPECANAARFPDAFQTVVVKDYGRSLDGLEIDSDSYIVIFTRGHQYDRVVLEKSLGTAAGYIGMISSKRKRQAIYETLMANGVKQEQLDLVHSPIGIDIGGETPEEIAVSIVAELVKVRSGQSK